MSSVTVIILTYNEAMHLERAIRSVQLLASQIIIVDSFSKDDTVAIAERCGALVLQNPFVNQSAQFNWALENAPITGDWILRLDADEIIEPDLAVTISTQLPALPTDVVGVNLNRKHIFMDRWVRHGGRYPLLMLRLWRRGHGRVEDRWMDEHVVVKGGRTVILKGGFADHNLNDITYFTDKHNKYATREAIEVLNQRYGLFAKEKGLTTASASGQAALKRFIKEKIYNRIPFTLSALLYFLWRYIFQLGFLDGRSGLVYHFLQGYWYRFLVGAKIMEFEHALKGATSNTERVQILERLTGLKLTN
ncbi:glycosyltransferase family 2 protein [Pseudomonas oryzae]|uniref:Glycosyltransferase involved in cell wall bisynthesis n=1 Tax=Pseudomonas oryzae TaxID=1392877 RepID=A0A1H1M5W4_9PSED|nr:glycosyltransferase family 2 protein [Pseudomonas oryzae]SDR82178.1 Glycosyltransferase involved in cell wall bisynthesis [Pseudomonas oryzae]